MPLNHLHIRIYGDPILRKKSQLVEEVGTAERMLIASMIETMHQHKGVGLAGVQVGINQRIFVYDIGEGPRVVINPQILRKSGSAVQEEGCLSIPGVVIPIKRAAAIRVKYVDENNNAVEQDLKDLAARVFQHETDHLNGKLIIDYVGWRQRLKLSQQLKKLGKNVMRTEV